MKGFTLLEVVVVLLIGASLVFLVLATFDTANRSAINQERLVYMNSSLRTASSAVTNSIASAGFGFSTTPDYAMRPFDNVNNAVLGAGFNPADPMNAFSPFLLTGAAQFTTKALLNSDALLTIRADGDCERLSLSTAAPTTWADPTYVMVACLPQPRCALASSDSFGSQWTSGHLFPEFNDRVILVVDESSPNQVENRAMRINPGAIVVAGPGAGCTGDYIQMTATSGGLQVSNAPLTTLGSPIAHFVTSALFYLGDDNRLYQFPLTYFSNPAELQTDRAIAESVDSFQLRYYPYTDTTFAAPLDACSAAVPSCPAGSNEIKDDTTLDPDGIPQIEHMRMIDVVLLSRSEKPDNFEYNNLGTRPALFNDQSPVITDSYRRRLVREQVLARNLAAFNVPDPNALYP